MGDDLAFALGAGMLATVNPCGFAMLPGYLSLVIAHQNTTRIARVGRALAASALMTAGFVAVFGVFGLLSLPLRGALQQYLPIVTVVIGVGMVVVGVLLLTGREVAMLLPKPARGAPSTRIMSMAGYGVAFAVASLSCTIGPFLAATGVALRGGSGLVTFLAYALGMGLVVAVLAVAAALASTAVATGIRRLLPQVPRIGGALLLATGAYVGYYGYYELRLFHAAGDPTDPVVDTAGEIQATLVSWVDAIGPVPLLAALAALTVGALFARRRTRAR